MEYQSVIQSGGTSSSLSSSSSSSSVTLLSSKDQDTLHQIIHKFFFKAGHLISIFRDSASKYGSSGGSVDRWFNINVKSATFPKSEFSKWQPDSRSWPNLIIESYLNLRDFVNSDAKLYLTDELGNEWLVAKFGSKQGRLKQEVVLERWLVELNPEDALKESADLSKIYEKCTQEFKSLFGFLSNLPAAKLKAKLDLLSDDLKIGYRILDPHQPISSKGRFGLSKPLIKTYENSLEGRCSSHTLKEEFKPIATPAGSLAISCTYRKDWKFHLIYNLTVPLSPTDLDSDRRRSLIRKHSTASSNSLYSTKNDSLKGLSATPQTPMSVTSLVAKSAANNNSSTSLNSVPNFHRSSSNVSLAAILRAQRNSFSSSSLTVGRPANKAASPGNDDLENDVQGMGIKYMSSFRNTRRNSMNIDSVPNESPRILRNYSYDSMDEVKAHDTGFSDTSISEFVSLIDATKYEFKAKQKLSNDSDSLYRFQTMRLANESLTSDLSNSLLLKTTPRNRKLSTSFTNATPRFTAMAKAHLSNLDSHSTPSTPLSQKKLSFISMNNSPIYVSDHQTNLSPGLLSRLTPLATEPFILPNVDNVYAKIEPTKHYYPCEGDDLLFEDY